MKKINIHELETRVLEIANKWSNTDGVDIVNNKNELVQLLLQDEFLDIDEIKGFSASYLSIEFTIVRKGGSVDRDTRKRTGQIGQALIIELKFRKFSDGGFDVKLDLVF
jgi:hypothetical protein